jgi:DNA-binding transcriptional regulator GbsR (MarR family)
MQEPFSTSLDSVETSDMVENLEVTDPEVGLFLVSRVKARYLFPFIHKEYSLSEAAKELKTTLVNLRYWVRKMEEFGLVRVTRLAKRKGSPIKYYRSVAHKFTFPLERLPASEVDEILFNETELPTYKRAAKALNTTGRKNVKEWLLELYMVDKTTAQSIRPKQGSLEEAEITNIWWLYRLTPEQAKTFRAELNELRDRYNKLSEENPETLPLHISHLMLSEEG